MTSKPFLVTLIAKVIIAVTLTFTFSLRCGSFNWSLHFKPFCLKYVKDKNVSKLFKIYFFPLTWTAGSMSGYGSSSSITVVPTGAVAMAATLNKAEGSRPGNRGLNKALEDAVRDMLFRGGTPPAADRPFPLPEADEGDFSHFDLKLKASRKIKRHFADFLPFRFYIPFVVCFACFKVL